MSNIKPIDYLHTNDDQLNYQQVKVMGIVNVTPDSFSDGGKFIHFDNALTQVDEMVKSGVDIIDIGGESTRPGAKEVSEEDELKRVIPLLKAIKEKFSISVSIDTSKALVMEEAIAHGADMINDVRALQNEGCLAVLAKSNVPVCLMHMQGMPRTMQTNPQYDNLITDITTFFNERIIACEQAGIAKSRIILDPGFGFGKSLLHNLQLLAHIEALRIDGCPILVGISRKSMLGQITGRDVGDRLAASVAAAVLAVQNGANIVRAHDVKETVDGLKVWSSLTAVN